MISPVIGKPIDRIDGKLKVTGAARYAAEATVPDALHAVIVQSTFARGKITSIDLTRAKSAAGVRLILTPQNVPRMTAAKNVMFGEKRMPLSDMDVHYAGQHVALVVADTLERAEAAAAMIEIKYEQQPVAIELNDSAAGVEKPAQSFAGPLQLQRGNVQQALTTPGLTTISQTYNLPVETHNPMEMSATIARWDADDRVTVWDATQYLDGVHGAVAAAFELKPENVRVICPYTGGGFGCKGAQWPHILLAVAAAKEVKASVKLMLTRQQMFTSCGHRPELSQTLTLAADRDGKLVALQHDTIMHGSRVGEHIEPASAASSAVMYATPNFSMSHTVHRVDVATPTFMRAPGENPGMFALECAMDELAVAAKIDPVQLRVINHADKHPTNGLPWSEKSLLKCYEIGAEKFGWSKRSADVGSMKNSDGWLMGWGMASATYPAHRFPGTASIRLYNDERGIRAVGSAATQDIGTGTWTIGTQFTAALTGLPIEKCKFELGDSILPVSGVSGGSATAAGVGQALTEAADALKAALLKLAGDDSPLKGFEPYQVEIRGGVLVARDEESKSQPIAPLIEKTGKAFVEGSSIAASHNGQPGTVPPPSSKPARAGGEGEDYNANEHKYAMQSFGCHFVEIVIDPGHKVHVKRVVSVMDIGKVINAKTCRSQVIGGVVMGIGQALLEATVYDKRTGRPITDNLADYAVCVNADVHSIEPYFIDEPDPHFVAFGNRGVGEIGITGIAAAVANAIYHATGKRVRDLPITPDKLM